MTERTVGRRAQLRRATGLAGAVALAGLGGPRGAARAQEDEGAPPPGEAPPDPPASLDPPDPTAEPSPPPPPAGPGAERPLERGADGVLTAAGRARGELSPAVTPTAAHYVVTKNPVADPVLEAASWRLVLDGEVNRPVQVDFATLLQLPAVEQTKTLECISNFTTDCDLAAFGCDLVSTAVWRGARVADVLALAGGLRSGAVSLRVLGADEFSSAVPARLALDPDAILAYTMNGEPLPRRHGYPVRMLVPGRYGMKNAKWVVGIRALRTEHVDWYGQRNWDRQGVVKTMSRIDTPAPGARLPAGRVTVAGIAYAGDRGVAAVELSPDGGRSWQPAVFLEEPLGRDAWRRWLTEVDVAPSQRLTLVCRAVDGLGQPQIATFKLPQPDGASGLHRIECSGV